MAYWQGDEWRWFVSKHRDPTIHTVQVIEPATADRPPAERRVPFGFSVAEPEPEPGLEPKPELLLGWLEGFGG